MSTTIPLSEIELLARAFEPLPFEVDGRLARLSEVERTVLELCAGGAGEAPSEREIAGRLGLTCRELRRIRAVAGAKLHHPAYGP